MHRIHGLAMEEKLAITDGFIFDHCIPGVTFFV
jgi:hypothetical protein